MTVPPADVVISSDRNLLWAAVAKYPQAGIAPSAGPKFISLSGERIFYGTAVKQRKKAVALPPKAVRNG